jgi:ABC-type phosphate transport system permease subunit
VFVLVLLGAIMLELFIGGLPAFRQFGFSFLWSAEWNPVREVFGAAVPIYDTIVTSVLALILAVPLSFGIAFYLTDLAPLWLRGPVGTAIELLAAIPSIIYGMWGFFVIAPLMAQYVQPWVSIRSGAAGYRRAVPGASVRHRHFHGGSDPRCDDHSLHRRHDARRVPYRAARI